MKLAHYLKSDRTAVGFVKDGSLIDLNYAAKKLEMRALSQVKTIDEILSKDLLTYAIQADEKTWEENDIEGIPLEKVRLQSPILFPEKILLTAINYVSHGKEQKVTPPSEPYFFTKFRNSIIGHGDSILAPKASNKVDWEVELAVIIGKKGKYVPRSEAMNYVAGYTIANDVSFRDLLFREGSPAKTDPLGHNWVKGKSLDASFPLGPWLVTPDEMTNPYESELMLSVNGSVKQRSRVGEMIFKIDELIEYLSNGITLSPGDVISTGTPLGVAVFTGAPYLKDGDIVEARIDGIGVLRNSVEAEG